MTSLSEIVFEESHKAPGKLMICFYLLIYKKIYFNNKKMYKNKNCCKQKRKIESCNRQKEEKMRGQIVVVSPVKFLFEIIDIILIESVQQKIWKCFA